MCAGCFENGKDCTFEAHGRLEARMPDVPGLKQIHRGRRYERGGEKRIPFILKSQQVFVEGSRPGTLLSISR